MNSPPSAALTIEQGSVFLADMHPLFRAKPGKIRPVIVVQSTDTLRAQSSSVVVVPLTSKLGVSDMLRIHLSPGPGLKIDRPSVALINQILTLDRSLILKELGMVSPVDLEKIINGIKFLLNIS